MHAIRLALAASMAEPRVSAIIIVYNGEPFLHEAIDSIVAQTFADWELLVVDDGSTDGSAAVARRFAEADPRIRVIAHPDGGNHGMSATRNLGLAKARGAFVAFLDCDDVWLPSKLDEQVGILDAEPTAGMIYGRTLIWHSWAGGSTGPDFYYSLGVEPNRLHSPPQLFKLLIENKAQTPTTCNALMRAELFQRVGRFEDAFRGMFEDQTFFAKALLHSPAYVSDRTWAKYRQHPDSCSAVSDAAGGDPAARRRFLVWCGVYVMTHGAGNRLPALWALLRASRPDLRLLRRLRRRLIG